MKKQLKTMVAVIAALSLLSGCMDMSGAAPDDTAPGSGKSGNLGDTLAVAATEGGTAGEGAPGIEYSAGNGSGNIIYSEDVAVRLNSEQEGLLLDLMTHYYESLLQMTAFEVSSLFSDDAQTQAAANLAVWQYLVGLREMQKTDLSLTAYQYELTVTDIEEEDGIISVTCMENSIQNFAATPDIDSECFDIYHRFTMKDTENGWKLTQHMQMDTLYWNVMGRYLRQEEQPQTNVQSYYEQRVGELLANVRDYVALRSTQGEAPADSVTENEYNRAAAVEYAHRWADDRNNDWPDYSRNGGNCQNYVSQCLLAGGIPMDPYGTEVWKWYGSAPNNLSGMQGRSGSWSAVKQFVEYAALNTGYGLNAWVDAPYYTGEPGDVLELGNSDDWRHTVIIVDVVTDSEGNTVDYLIDSNTAGMKNYPASAYHYACQMLVKINGWNS